MTKRIWKGSEANEKQQTLMEKYNIQKVTTKSAGRTLTDWTFYPEEGEDPLAKKEVYALMKELGYGSSVSGRRFVQSAYSFHDTASCRTGYTTSRPMI